MTTVFTNGCFDILHRGHIELLKYCREIGSVVIVGINTDKSIQKLKGPSRPINNQEDRKFMLNSLKFVDQVYFFNEETPYNLIKSIKPDIIVKGGDYIAKNVVGHDLCEVKIFEYIDGYSTTEKIKDIINR
jgi:D-beta-D-heptose 7-phosphate kinase/D-beta-D-heptose 1-phosphate adenosyltransferase